MSVSPEKIARLRGLLAEATPGPWGWDEKHGVLVDASGSDVLYGMGYDGLWQSLVGADGDIALIVFAVNALPSLLDEIEKLREEVKWRKGVTDLLLPEGESE